jgi:hypothetical protein
MVFCEWEKSGMNSGQKMPVPPSRVGWSEPGPSPATASLPSALLRRFGTLTVPVRVFMLVGGLWQVLVVVSLCSTMVTVCRASPSTSL